jgi:hypothetical protein
MGLFYKELIMEAAESLGEREYNLKTTTFINCSTYCINLFLGSTGI